MTPRAIAGTSIALGAYLLVVVDSHASGLQQGASAVCGSDLLHIGLRRRGGVRIEAEVVAELGEVRRPEKPVIGVDFIRLGFAGSIRTTAVFLNA